MTELDQALEALRADYEDPKAQSGFYDLFLNSLFIVPTVEEMIDNEDKSGKEKVDFLIGLRRRSLSCSCPAMFSQK
jgi:peptidyl-prolyl cis-trans isomerase C